MQIVLSMQVVLNEPNIWNGTIKAWHYVVKYGFIVTLFLSNLVIYVKYCRRR